MAKDILRQDVKDVIAAHKGGELGARSVATRRVPAVGIGVKNATSSNVATGTPLKIDGFSQELEYDVALSKLLNDALYLAATAPDETTPVEQIATTLEPIPAGKLGRAEAAIFPARVTFPDGGDDYAFASATFVAASSGPFRIVAKSKLSAERVAVCALAKVAGSEGGDASVRWWNLDGTEIWNGETSTRLAVKSREISVGHGLLVEYGGDASRPEDDIIALLDWRGFAVCADAEEAATPWTELAPEVRDSARFKVRRLLLQEPLCYEFLADTGCVAIQSGIYFQPSFYVATDSETGDENTVEIDRNADGSNLLLTNHIRGGRSISVDPAPSPCEHFLCCENAYVAEINWGGFSVDETQVFGLNLGYHLALQTQEKENNDGSVESVVLLDEHGKATLEWTGFRVGRVEPQSDGTWFYGEPFLVKRLNFCSACFSVVEEPGLNGARFELSDTMKGEIFYGIDVYLERTEELFLNAKRLTLGESLTCECIDEGCEGVGDAPPSKDVRIDWAGVRYVNGDNDLLGVARKMRFSSAFDLSFKDDVASISISQTTLEGLKGEKGDKGDPGEPGKDGEKGEKGDTGDKGEKGDPGEKGADGQDGATGPQGPPGPAGADGKDGVDGTNGVDGKDFTFEDFTPEQLEGLKGEPGKDGEDGKDADWSTLHIGDAVRKPKLRKPVATGVVDDAPLLSELGDPSTVDVVSYVGEFSESDAIAGYDSPPTADVLGDVTLVNKTVVTGVSLGLADEASDGAIAVVVAVECADGSVVETTKYLSLNLTTETVRVVSARKYQKGVLTGLGSPKASNAVTHTNGPVAYETVVTGYANVKTAELNVEEVVVDAETANCVGLPETHVDRDKIGTEILGDEGGETDANS